jgi:arylsulfatase A-like enzyme
MDRPMSAATDRLPGFVASVRAGIAAGCVCGLLVGFADGTAASFLTSAPLGPLAWLGCVAGAILQYSLLAGVALGLLGALGHPYLRRFDAPRRYRTLLGLGLGAALFAEIYWWTRPYVFDGHSALSFERLASAAVMAVIALALGVLAARGVTRLSKNVQLGLAVLATAAWLGGALYLSAQQSVGAQRGVINERNQDLPNVVLVVVDALRQDVLGCYGNKRVQTPNIDRLAQRGVVFENAFVQAPYTWTSFGSLLTGKYPRRHGLIKMVRGAEMLPNTTLPLHLKSATRTDGRMLQPDDVLTASFHTGALRADQGLHRGFDLLFEETAGHELADVASPWSLFRRELLLWVFKNRISKRLDSGLVASEACRWIESIPGKRFMTMVHLFTTHTPYDPPAEFRVLYCDPAYTGPIQGAFYSEHATAIESGKWTPNDADVQRIRDLYYGGVSHADALIGKLVASLEKSGALANTIVIITSDHGESLGEDGLWEHNHLVRRELLVPLIVSWPGHLPEGKRVPALVDEIDVFPTVCALAGLELPPPTNPREIVDGVNLLPLVNGDVARVREHSYAEVGTGVSIQDLQHLLSVPRAALTDKSLAESLKLFKQDLALTRPLSRFVTYAGTSTDERDLIQDPTAHLRALALFATLDAWSRRMPIPVWKVSKSHRDHDVERDLKHIGYTGDDDPATETTPAEKERLERERLEQERAGKPQ